MEIKHYYPFLFLFFSAVYLQAQQRPFFDEEFKKNLFEANHLISKSTAPNSIKLKEAGLKYRLDSLTRRRGTVGNWHTYKTDHYKYNSQALLKSKYALHQYDDEFREYFYNVDGLLEMVILQVGDSLANSWRNNTKVRYDYNADSSQNYTVIYTWSFSLNQWTPLDSAYMHYNSAGLNTSSIRYLWNKVSNSWDNKWKTDFTYSGGKLISLLNYSWDTVSTSWTTSSAQYINLNSAGYTTGWSNVIYRPATSTWDSIFKAEYTYDLNYNPIEEIYENYDINTQQWIISYRYTYQYNLNLNMKDLIASPNFQFIPDEREYIVNQPLSYQVAKWDTSAAQWIYNDSTTYHYSQQIISLAESKEVILECYPNPAKEELYFKLPDNRPARVEIYNSTGQMVIQSDLRISRPLDIRTLKAGAYTYQLYFGKERQQGKLMVE